MSDYKRTYAGTFDPDAILPDDIVHNTSGEAAEELACYMSVQGGHGWKEKQLIHSLETLIDEGRRRYFNGYHIGDPAVLGAIEPGSWRYLDGYAAWLAKIMPEGTIFCPPSILPKGDAGVGMDRIDDEWELIHEDLFKHPVVTEEARQRYLMRLKREGKEPAENTRRRIGKYQTKYGTLNESLGDYRLRPIGSVPFYSIWPLAEAWWRRERGGPFRPNFEQAASSIDARARGSGPRNKTKSWTKVIDTDALNEAGHFWTAFTGKLDFLIDLDDVWPDEAFWVTLADEVGILSGEGGPLTTAEMPAMEHSRIYRIAELTARAAKDGWTRAIK